MPTATRSPLLTSDFMARLDRFDLLSRKMLNGKMKGERRSKRRGQSVEFADYRNYVLGDDLRFIDWNIYGRLDKLFIKLFQEEEDLALYVLVDTSKSGDFGTPNKLDYIKQVAAALGYVGLVNYNRVSISAMSDGVTHDTGGLRGRRRVSTMLEFVDALRPAGTSDFGAACKRFALTHRAKGVLVVLSDFFDKSGFEHGLRYVHRQPLRHVRRADPQPAGDRAGAVGRPEVKGRRGRRLRRGQHHPPAARQVQEQP